MIKQRIFTALGIAFSLLIVFGGWGLTSKLLESHETDLLSAVGKVMVAATPPATPIDEANYPTLTDSEIYTVLKLWELDAEEIPHEPKEGQISMEQAIAAGKEGLAFFVEQGILPSEFAVYDKTNAYLAEKSRNITQLIETSPALKEEDIRSAEELSPFYSYWTVTFSSDQSSATLVINSATGQIWEAKMECPSATENIEKLDENAIVDNFYAYLGFEENALLDTVVQKSGTKTDDVLSQLMLNIRLVTKE